MIILVVAHCVVCSSSIYGFWLPLWYLQTLLICMSSVKSIRKCTKSLYNQPKPYFFRNLLWSHFWI